MSTRAACVAWGGVLVLGAASAMGSALLPNLSSFFVGWTRWGHEAPVVSMATPDRESAMPSAPAGTLDEDAVPPPRSLRLELAETVTDPDDTRAAVLIDGALWIATGGGLLHLDPRQPGSSRWWTTADGLPDHRLTAITAWADGLVLGTEGGALIHLGVPDPGTRDGDLLLDVRSVVALGDSRISDLVVDDGMVWVGTWGNGAFVGDPADPASFRALGPSRGLRARRITSLARIGGELVAGTAGAGLWVRHDDGTSRLFVAKGGLVSDFILDVALVEDRVVAAGPGGVSRYRDGALQTFRGGDGLAGGVVRAVAGHGSGRTMLALSGGRTGVLGSTRTQVLPSPPDGLARGIAGPEVRWMLQAGELLVAGTARGLLIDDGQGYAWITHDGPGSNDLTSVAALDGTLLVGTWDLGPWQSDGGGWVALPTPSSEINDVALTSAGAWLATSKGLARVDDEGIRTWGLLHGLAHEHVGALAVDGAAVIVGTSAGVQRFDGVGFETLGGDDALGLRNVYSVAVAGDRVWAGTLEGLWSLGSADASRFRYETGELPDSWINGVAVASDGAVWAGTYDQGVARGTASGWTSFTERDGLSNGWVNPDAILPLDDGTVLFGTMGGGLLRLGPTGLLDSWSVADGLAGDDVTSLARDGDTIWVATRSGLSRMEVVRDRS